MKGTKLCSLPALARCLDINTTASSILHAIPLRLVYCGGRSISSCRNRSCGFVSVSLRDQLPRPPRPAHRGSLKMRSPLRRPRPFKAALMLLGDRDIESLSGGTRLRKLGVVWFAPEHGPEALAPSRRCVDDDLPRPLASAITSPPKPRLWMEDGDNRHRIAAPTCCRCSSPWHYGALLARSVVVGSGITNALSALPVGA